MPPIEGTNSIAAGTWFANTCDKEKAYDLQKLAGQALNIGAKMVD